MKSEALPGCGVELLCAGAVPGNCVAGAVDAGGAAEVFVPPKRLFTGGLPAGVVEGMLVLVLCGVVLPNPKRPGEGLVAGWDG